MRIFKTDKRNKKIVGIIAEIIVGAVLLSVGGCETLYFKDSETFLFWSTLDYRRGYTLYPLFIKFCRIVFGETHYIDAIWILQSILALISILFLAEFLRKEYKLKGVLCGLTYILLYLPYTFTLPEAMATHYIFTEGISISLFYFSFLLLLFLLKNIRWYYVMVLIIIDYMLFLTRPQLFIILLIEICIIALDWINKRFLPNQMRIRIATNLSIVVMLVFSIYISLGLFSSLIYDKAIENQLIDSLSGKIICTMEEDDAVNIEERDRYIFDAIYKFAAENGTLIKDFPNSWLEYEEIHVSINTNLRDYEQVVWDAIENNHAEYNSEESYKARNRVLSRLLQNNRKKFLGIILRLMPSSMVASVFIQPHAYRLWCYIISLILYFLSVLILYYSLKIGIEDKYRQPHISATLLIVINALFCNIALYGQQRYVIYGMGLFYATLMITILGCYRDYIYRRKQ